MVGSAIKLKRGSLGRLGRSGPLLIFANFGTRMVAARNPVDRMVGESRRQDDLPDSLTLLTHTTMIASATSAIGWPGGSGHESRHRGISGRFPGLPHAQRGRLGPAVGHDRG